MKIAAYEVRPDERQEFEALTQEYEIQLVMTQEALSDSTLHYAEGCRGVTTLGQSSLKGAVLDQLKSMGVRYISTRSIGYNHVDLQHARQLGLLVSNASYAPNGVADYTVMLILMAIRNYKPALWRIQVNDYSLAGLQGRELRRLTVGIMGTGKIGSAVIKNLSGFGCPILAYDVHENPEVFPYARYVDLDTLYRESDIISLHMPLLDSTYHMINMDALKRMKKGVVLINCARGELMKIEDIITGVEDQLIGGLALDVFEHEAGIYHQDRRTDIIKNRNMAYLRQFPNVITTQHMAFYTDDAVKSMVRCGIESLLSFEKTGDYPLRLT